MAEINFCQTELSYVGESYISQLENNAQGNKYIKVLLLGSNKNKDLKKLKKLKAKFAEGEKK